MELVDLISSDEELRQVTRRFEEAVRAPRREADAAGHCAAVAAGWHLRGQRGLRQGGRLRCGMLDAFEHPESHGLSRAKLEHLGTPHPPYWLFGEYFLLAGRLDEAESTFEKAHKTKPDAARLHFQLARIDLKRRRAGRRDGTPGSQFSRGPRQRGGRSRTSCSARRSTGWVSLMSCSNRIEKLLAQRPGDAALACFAARQYVASGQFDKAAAQYNGLLAKDSAAPVHAGLLEVCRKQGRLDEVLRVLGRAGCREFVAR